MIVKVIAHTVFLDVPGELLPAGASYEMVRIAGQDKGTEAERLVECAGRTCYDSYGKGRPSADYHQHIMDVDHGSVTEHASLSFFLSGISRGCTHELVRHRVGVAISQRSTRYVDEDESEWALHPLLAKYGHLGDKEVTAVLDVARHGYAHLVLNLQHQLEMAGVDKATARKQARGAARGLLGNALSTEMVWTCNIRALKGILAQRANRHADAEIRLLANQLYEKALPYWPTYLGCYEKAECPDGIGYELVKKKVS